MKKNIVIALLVLTTIWQTGKLWYGDSSDHNFFVQLLNEHDNYNYRTVDLLFLFKPHHLIVNHGDQLFSLVYPKEESNFIENKSYEILKLTFASGNFLSLETFDPSAMLGEKSLILQYNFPMDVDSFAQSLDERAHIVKSKMKQFDTVYMYPATGLQNVKVCFVDQQTSQSAVFSVRSELNIPEQLEDRNLEYLSSLQNGLAIFSTNIFLPHWVNEKISYSSLQKFDPYFYIISQYPDDFKIRLKDVFLPFFNNKTVEEEIISQHTYMLKNDFNILRYHSVGLLEFQSYEHGSASDIELYEAFNIFKSFLKTSDALLIDHLLKDNISLLLSSAEFFQDKKEWHFNFDLSVNQFAVEISDELKHKHSMDSYMEVVLNKKGVKTYRRFTSFLIDSSKKKNVNVDFSKALDLSMQKNDLKKVKKMILAYVYGEYKDIDLYWLMESDNMKICQNSFE